MISLEIGPRCSAARDQCGSCSHFARRGGYDDVRDQDSFGICKLTLPPWVNSPGVSRHSGEECEVDYRTVRDTDVCSFWSASGYEYRQVKIWSIT